MIRKQCFYFWPETAILVVSILLLYCLHLNEILFWPINRLPETTGPALWANLTILGDTLVTIVFILLFIRKNPQLVWTALVAAVITAIVVNVMKPTLDIARPPAILDHSVINIIGPAHHRRSMPSGHSATIFTLSGVLVLYFRMHWQRLLLIVIAMVIGMSRIAVGVHWPGDVLVGAVIGLSAVTAGYCLVLKWNWSANRISQLVFGGIFIFATLVLLIRYDTGYQEAFWLQKFIALIILLFGGNEYRKLYGKINSIK